MAYLYRLIVLALLLASGSTYAAVCTQYKTGAGFNYGQQWKLNVIDATNSYCTARNITGCYWANPGQITAYSPQSNPPQNLELLGTSQAGSLTSLGAVGWTSRTGDYCDPPPPTEPEACASPLLRAKDGVRCLTQLEKDCDDRSGTNSGPLDASSNSSWSKPSTICDGTAVTQQDAAAGYGCTVSQLELTIGYQPTPTTYAVRMQGKFTGSVCSPSTLTPTGSSSSGTTTTPTTSTPSTAPACPDGQPGTVNGVTVCIPFSSSPGSTSTPGGGGTTTTTVNPDGSTTTTTKTEGTSTTCTGTSCVTTVSGTTTITVTPSGGGTGTTTTTTTSGTKTGTQTGFCTENPKAVICGGEEKSSFGGACTGGFVCTGDAALCAVAKATNEQKCLLDEQSPEAELYETAKAANSTGLTTETVAISAASFDTSNALPGGAACITDMNITVMNKSVSLPFSSLCPHLAILGNLLLAVSFLLAVRIVGRG